MLRKKESDRNDERFFENDGMQGLGNVSHFVLNTDQRVEPWTSSLESAGNPPSRYWIVLHLFPYDHIQIGVQESKRLSLVSREGPKTQRLHDFTHTRYRRLTFFSLSFE